MILESVKQIYDLKRKNKNSKASEKVRLKIFHTSYIIKLKIIIIDHFSDSKKIFDY